MGSDSGKRKRLATLKPFHFSRRFVAWGRRHRDDEHSETLHDDSDDCDSIQGSGDSQLEEDEADSESTRYSDAHSTWELPLIKRDGVLSPLMRTEDVEAGPSMIVSDLTSRLGLITGNELLAGLDEVKESQSLAPLDAVPLEPVKELDRTDHQHLRSGTRDGEGNQEELAEEGSNHVELSKQDKGKGVELRPDWRMLKNPWAIVDAQKEEKTEPKVQEQQNLIEENDRLRTELENLKASILSQPGLIAAQPDTGTRLQTQSLAHRMRKLKSKHKSRPDTTLFETTTLRDLVFKHLFTSHILVNNTTGSDPPQQPDSPLTLDTPLTPAQIESFSQTMKSLLLSGRPLKQPIALCAICHLPKFKEMPNSQNSYIAAVLSQAEDTTNSTASPEPCLEDFHPVWGTSTCCRRYVCKACLGSAICRAISTQWWLDLGSHEICWLKCPVPICGRSLPLNDSDDVREVLQTLGVPNIEEYVSRFERVSLLRASLQTLSPLPGKEATRRSRVLHDRLFRYGKMRPLLVDVLHQDDAPPQVKVDLLSIDTPDGQSTLKVPIFTHLLYPRVPQTCIVCMETHDEFSSGDAKYWTKATRPFSGDWLWQIHSFPTPDTLPDCQHELHICRTCVSTHIETQIEIQGYNSVGNITCPTPDCGHIYTHAEIRRLATHEIFTAYDRLAVLNEVSNLPNFRWCLREGCSAGGLYDDPWLSSSPSSPVLSQHHSSWGPASSPEPNINSTNTNNQPIVIPDSPTAPHISANLIICGECHFKMCYACQTPWHADTTCAQARSLRSDPSQQRRTNRWIARNTKPCPGPGCGVAVQKGEGCFHMTCSRCRHEFCWECLADWGGIVDARGGELLREGHAPDCYFAAEGARLPTQVLGTDLAGGLARFGGVEGDEEGLGVGVIVLDE